MPAEPVTLRPGRAEDLKAIAAIEQAASSGPWSLSQFVSASLRSTQQMLVLEDATGDVLGFAVYQQVVDEATLMNIAIAPAAQGCGHGGALLEAVVSMVTGGGAQRLLLEVRESNGPARALYRRYGFVDDGRRRDYYPSADGREDAILMSLELESCSERA